MNTKIPDVFFIRRHSAVSTVEPQVSKIEDGRNSKTEPEETTMADCVKPLLTSMKLFGLYSKSGTQTNEKVMKVKSRRRWNGCMIYGLVVAISLWIDLARLFSMFTILCSVPVHQQQIFHDFILQSDIGSGVNNILVAYRYAMFSVFTADDTLGSLFFFKFTE